MLAGLATIVFACNSNPDNGAANTDSTNDTQHGAARDTSAQNQANPVVETMSRMMLEMHHTKATGNNDVDFAAMMMAHHKGAVEMSRVEVDKGTDAGLKVFAQKVIDDQNKEIAFMQDFLSKAPGAASSSSADFQKAMNASMMAMMNGNAPVYNNIDKDFAAQMIPHHQSAVDMAKAYLEYGQEKSLRTLCANIVDSQAKEISWLKEWLSRNKT